MLRREPCKCHTRDLGRQCAPTKQALCSTQKWCLGKARHNVQNHQRQLLKLPRKACSLGHKAKWVGSAVAASVHAPMETAAHLHQHAHQHAQPRPCTHNLHPHPQRTFAPPHPRTPAPLSKTTCPSARLFTLAHLPQHSHVSSTSTSTSLGCSPLAYSRGCRQRRCRGGCCRSSQTGPASRAWCQSPLSRTRTCQQSGT